MTDTNKMYKVRNRSASMVVYSIPEENIRREFQPGEIKTIRHGELEKLTYQPGGEGLIADYFLIYDNEAIQDLNIHTEPEYYMTDVEIIDLIKNGSMDAWLDCLDFAPEGVMEMIKNLSISVPLNDNAKREALKKKTGFDVTAAIQHMAPEQEEESAAPAQTASKRRVQPTAQAESAINPERRVQAPKKYNVVSK